MANYTKSELKNKKKKELIEIASHLNLDTSGTNDELVERIFTHKPSFDEMVDSAPVSKDGDLTISVEETDETSEEEDIPVGVEVNDPYTEGEKDEDTSESEDKKEDEDQDLTEEVTTEPTEDVAPTQTNMVAENTAEDILKGWQASIQNFYRRNTPGVAPTRPASPDTIAKELGVPESAATLAHWKNTIANHLRPVRGIAPAPPNTPKEIIKIIKSL